jgi:hypothetical protein
MFTAHLQVTEIHCTCVIPWLHMSKKVEWHQTLYSGRK